MKSQRLHYFTFLLCLFKCVKINLRLNFNNELGFQRLKLSSSRASKWTRVWKRRKIPCLRDNEMKEHTRLVVIHSRKRKKKSRRKGGRDESAAHYRVNNVKSIKINQIKVCYCGKSIECSEMFYSQIIWERVLNLLKFLVCDLCALSR